MREHAEGNAIEFINPDESFLAVLIAVLSPHVNGDIMALLATGEHIAVNACG